MKKLKLFSWICVLMFVITSFVLVGCGKTPNKPNIPGSSGGESGATPDKPQAQEVVLKDMRIVYVVDNHYYERATFIQLPNKEIIVVDPTMNGSWLANYVMFMTGRFEIDYLIVTNPNNISGASDIFYNMTVKNFYRPNMAIDLDCWDTTHSELYDDEMEYVKENLREQDKTGVEYAYKHDRYGNIDYNEQYLYLLALLGNNGTNIVPITNATKISDSYVSGGQTYSWSLDFYFNPVVDPENYNMEIVSTDNGKGYYLVGSKYWMDAEYSATFDFVYGDFKMGYFGEPTDNMLSKFVERANGKCQNYDMFITHYSNTNLSGSASGSKNMYHSWSNTFKKVDLDDIIFDKANVQTNCYMISFASLATENYGYTFEEFWNDKLGDDHNTILHDNRLVANHDGFNDQNIPMITINKNGTFSTYQFEYTTELVDESYLKG